MSGWPTIETSAPTFSAFVSECAECGAEVTAILGSQGKESSLAPCGHKASIKLVPNPRLRVPPAKPEHG